MLIREYVGNDILVLEPTGPLVAERANGLPPAGAAVVCSIRPQALALQAPEAGPNRIAGKVEQVTFLGELVHLRVAAAGGIILMVVGLPQDAARLRAGAAVTLTVEPDQVVVLQEQNAAP